MARRSSDMTLLLLILLLFSASIGFLHGTKVMSPANAVPTSEQLTVEDALDIVETLLLSGNMDQAAQMLMRPTMPEEIIDAILADKIIPLTPEQKISLLVAAIAYQPENEEQEKLLAKLASHFEDKPVYWYAFDRYSPFISAAQRWAKKEQKQELLDRWKKESFELAVTQNNVPVLMWLYTNDVRPTVQQASRLLDMVVTQNKDVAFIPLLVRQLNADVNFSADGKRTVLMKAAADGNYRMVQALLEVGADPDLILDSQVGSAVQAAYEQGYAKIETLLRQQK